ncbi:MAG: hypothetical protein ACI9XP_001618 [Lentimonas sp.]
MLGEYGVWSMEYGVWSMEYGVWSMERKKTDHSNSKTVNSNPVPHSNVLLQSKKNPSKIILTGTQKIALVFKKMNPFF